MVVEKKIKGQSGETTLQAFIKLIWLVKSKFVARVLLREIFNILMFFSIFLGFLEVSLFFKGSTLFWIVPQILQLQFHFNSKGIIYLTSEKLRRPLFLCILGCFRVDYAVSWIKQSLLT